MMDKHYHIFQNGTFKRKDNTLVLESNDERSHIPIEHAAAVFIHGQVTINTRVLDFAAKHGVLLHYFNWSDYYTGSFYPKESSQSGHTRIQQAKKHINTEERHRLAAEFVSASIEEMHRIVSYYHNRSYDLDTVQERLCRQANATTSTNDIDELMGVEGDARSSYYSIFGDILPETFAFDGRQYNPAPNKVNSLISFGNSLLYGAIETQLFNTHLDPTISYLHSPGERRHSLVLDVADVFKPMIVDRLIFRLLNRGTITEDDFRDEVDGCLLTESGRKNFVKKFEEVMERTVEHPDLNRNVSYQYLLRLEGYKIQKDVLDDTQYEGFRRWW